MSDAKTEKAAKKSAKKPAATSAEEYNKKQAGKAWTWRSLPGHLADLKKRPSAFAHAVKVLQKKLSLAADGKLGPKTLAMIRTAWPQYAPPKAAAVADASEADAGSG